MIKHMQLHTNTHTVTSKTPSQPVLGFVLPFSQIIKSCPLQETQAGGSEASDHHSHCPPPCVQPIRGPWIQSPSPNNHPELRFLSSAEASILWPIIGSSEGHKTLDLVSMQGWGQRKGRTGWRGRHPQQGQKSHTKAAPHTTGEQLSPGSQGALLQIMCYFLPKNQGKVSNIDSQRLRTKRPNSTSEGIRQLRKLLWQGCGVS